MQFIDYETSFTIYSRRIKGGDNENMQKAIHILSNSEVYSFNLESYEKKAVMKAAKSGLLICPRCQKQVSFAQSDICYFRHEKPNQECDLSLTDEEKELRIERVQAAIFKQLNEIFFDEKLEIDVWAGGKRYHIVGPNFRIRIFNDIHPYNYMNDRDINIFVTEYHSVFGAEQLMHRDVFYGYNMNRNSLIMYNFKDSLYPVTYCPVDNFYIDEEGFVYKKNFILEKDK